MKNTERFSDRVENYVRYRPHYPEAIIPFLSQEIGLSKDWVVADIGSGTGISSELFLKNGNRVHGVEPNPEMRAAAESIFKNEKQFVSVNGTAEATTLQNNSIDLVIAGQAFHWFNEPAAQKEFRRIASPNGHLALIWNERKSGSEFQKAYEEMLFEFAPGYAETNHRNVDNKKLDQFFSPQTCHVHLFPNAQWLDFESLKGRLLSSSYAPLEAHINHQPMMKRLEEIFRQFNNKGQLAFEYDCRLYYGRLK